MNWEIIVIVYSNFREFCSLTCKRLIWFKSQIPNTHYTKLETSQLSPPVAGKRYWNTNESVNPEEGQEDKDEEREEEEDGDADSFDKDA